MTNPITNAVQIMKAAAVNTHLQELKRDHAIDLGKVSDGYHTFDELYDHRITLFIALATAAGNWNIPVWRSKAHSDGSVWNGWFILGLFTEAGKQITYHLPDSRWDETGFARSLDKAPTWDGHTSADVLQRLKSL